MIRVLVLSPAAGLGGAERVLLDLLEQTRTCSDLTVTVLSMEEGPLLDRVRDLGVRIELLPMPATLASSGKSMSVSRAIGVASELVRYARELARVVEPIGADIIHANGFKAHMIASLLPGRSKRVWHLHDFVGDRRLGALLSLSFAWRCDLAIANSHAVANDARSYLPGTAIEVVHNGVDTSRFTSVNERSSDSPLSVGLVATYARWKGHDVFLRAVAELLKRPGLPEVRYRIVGGPIYRTLGSQWSTEELNGVMRQLHIEEHVELVSFVAEAESVYRDLDVFVHASTKREPFGRTIVEAMASGCAVIATRGGGSDELYRDGIEALGVPPADSTALANAIEMLLRDRALRNALGSAARTRALEFSSRAFGEKVVAAWRNLIGDRRRS